MIPDTETIIKFLGVAIAGAIGTRRATGVIVLATAEALLKLFHCDGVAMDIAQLRDNLVKGPTADVEEKLARAAAASNAEAESKAKRLIAEIELEEKRLAKATKGELAQLNLEAKRRQAAAIEAQLEVVKELAQKLKMEGGQLFLNEENLTKLLKSSDELPGSLAEIWTRAAIEAGVEAETIEYPNRVSKSTKVSTLELSMRSRKALQRMNINTIGELARCTEEQLLAQELFGKTSLNEIKQQLASLGFSLAKSDNPMP